MFGFGSKRKIKALESRFNSIVSNSEKLELSKVKVERTFLVGEDEEILDLIDLFSELNHQDTTSYYDVHEVLNKLDEYALVGSIARLKGMEEETNSSIHVSPIATTVAFFVTAIVALNQLAKSVLIAVIIVFTVLAVANIIGNLSSLNRKGRKRVVYFRSLLEYQLEKRKNNNLIDKE